MLPPALLQVSDEQLGVVARWQLVGDRSRCQLSRGEVDGHVQRGALRPIERGVYRVAGAPRLPEQAAFAAALRAGPRASVTGPMVLGHLGVEGFAPAGPFAVLTQPGRRIRGVDFSHRPDLQPGRRVLRRGSVRLVTAVEAAIDAAAWRTELGDRKLRLAYDQLRWRGWTTPERFAVALHSRGSRDPGARAYLEMLSIDGFEPESEGERDLGRLLRRFDPAPEPQVWVTACRRVDWYFEALRVGIEYLGAVDHDHLRGWLADRDRERELAARGVRILGIRAHDLLDEAAVLTTVASALTLRAAQLGIGAPALRG